MILRELPIAARVLEPQSGLVFIVAGKAGHICDGIPMLSERITTVAPFDGTEPDHEGDKQWDRYDQFGWNNYENSNVHQWLNSDKAVWYAPAHGTDAAPDAQNTRYGEQPSSGRNGYLCQFSDVFKECLVEAQVPVLTRTARNEGELHNVPAKMYLPSRTEVIRGEESGYAEGKPLPVCYDPGYVNMIPPTDADMKKYGRSWNPTHDDVPYGAPQMYDPRYAWWYFLRTPNLQYGFLVRNICSYGSLSYTYANNDVVGIRPVCNLSPETPIELNHGMKPTEEGVSVRLYQIKI